MFSELFPLKEYNNSHAEKTGYKLLLPLFLAEIAIGYLYFLDPLLGILPFLLGIIAYLFFRAVFVSPFFWALLMVLGTGLEHWGQIGGGLTLFHLAWGLGIGSAFVFILYRHYVGIKFSTPINKYVFLYIGFALFTLIWSPNKESGFIYLLTTLALFFFFLYIKNFVIKDSHYKYIVYVLIGISVFISIIAFYQLLTFDPWHIAQAVQSESDEKILRAAGTFQDPNVAATYLMVALLFSFSMVFYSNIGKMPKVIILGASLISFGGLIATFSRTGWVAFTVGIFMLVLFQKNKKNIIYLFAAILVFMFILVFFTKYGEFITQRVVTIFDIMGDISVRTRVFMAVSGIWMFLDYPIFGIGYRAFPVMYDYYMHPLTPQIILYMKESHTLLITLIAEMGIIGVSIVFLWFRRVFIDNFANIRKSVTPIGRAIQIGCFVNFVALNINFFFYGSLFPHFDLIWLIFGFIYGNSVTSASGDTESTPAAPQLSN